MKIIDDIRYDNSQPEWAWYAPSEMVRVLCDVAEAAYEATQWHVRGEKSPANWTDTWEALIEALEELQGVRVGGMPDREGDMGIRYYRRAFR